MANIPEAKMNYGNQETGKYTKDCNIEVIVCSNNNNATSLLLHIFYPVSFD